MICCSECAAETDGSSAFVDKDVTSEESCVGNVLDADDSICRVTDVESEDAVADDTEDTSTQPAVDSVAVATDLGSKVLQSGDEIQTDTAAAFVKDDIDKLDNVVQHDGDRIDNKPMWYFADINKQWRKFNIDLMPKVIIDIL